MDYNQIIAIIGSVASFLFVTLIPSIIALVKNVKAKKNAKTEAERKAIENDMLNQVSELIASAETTFKALDQSLKNQGSKGCGELKKDTVMNKLQTYALQKGVAFDADYWSKKIDELVAVTKKVNAKENYAKGGADMALFELKIYGEDDEILRTYESNRLRWGKLLQAVKISEESKGKTASEQLESIYEVFQSIFPKLTRDDY